MLQVENPAEQRMVVPQEVEQEQAESDDFDVAVQLKSFDQVWSTIKNSHWDSDLVGDSWDAARDRIRPQVEQAKSVQQVREAMEALIRELGQSHFGIIPADSYEVVGTESGDGYAGLEFRLVDEDTVLVSRVVKGSPADAAGIKPGWEIVKIGDRQVADLLPKLEKAAHGPLRMETIVGMTLTRMASGPTGKEKAFKFLDGSQAEQDVSLVMSERPGKDSKFGNLPEMRVHFEQRTIEQGIGYFRFNVFFDPMRVMPAFRESVSNEQHQKGMIIDLRGNVGGIAGMTMGMARPFVPDQTKLGVMYMKGTELKFVVFPEPEQYPGKVAVLIDECSISSAEILSGGLKDIGAAKIFGRRTAGLALPSMVVKLPNGDGFQYAFANYISEGGKVLEGDGVSPDEAVALTRESLLKQQDPVLAAAISWLGSTKPSADSQEDAN